MLSVMILVGLLIVVPIFMLLPIRIFFSYYTPGDFGVLKMGNNDTSKVIGIGTVCLKTSNGTKLILKNVRHAPDIRLHLISTSVLDDDGYFNTFGGAQWKLTKGSLVVTRGMKFSGLYWLKASILFNDVNVVDCDNYLIYGIRGLATLVTRG